MNHDIFKTQFFEQPGRGLVSCAAVYVRGTTQELNELKRRSPQVWRIIVEQERLPWFRTENLDKTTVMSVNQIIEIYESPRKRRK